MTTPWTEHGLTVDDGADGDAYAVFDAARRHRYLLGRRWDDTGRGALVFLMLNPSTADAFVLDPTVTRCVNRAKRLGYDGIVVVNAFSLRTPSPAVMKAEPEPGDDAVNDACIAWACRRADVVAAWGPHARHRGRGAALLALLGRAQPRSVNALRITKDGSPGHPLYVPSDAPLIPFGTHA